jgi:hypothetical protein
MWCGGQFNWLASTGLFPTLFPSSCSFVNSIRYPVLKIIDISALTEARTDAVMTPVNLALPELFTT